MIDEIIMLRHGRTAYNLHHRLQGQVDMPLDIVGQWQVDQTGLELAQQYYWAKVSNIAQNCKQLPQPESSDIRYNRIDEYKQAPAAKRKMRIVSSDLFRAIQTAHAFGDILGLPIALNPGLREQNFGKWEGLTEAEVNQVDPLALKCWRTHHDEERHGIEPRTEVGRRGLDTVIDLVNEEITNPEPMTLMLVGHGSLFGATIEAMLNLDSDDSKISNMDNAFWSKITPHYSTSNNIIWELKSFNCGPSIADLSNWNDGPDELRNPSMPKMSPGL